MPPHWQTLASFSNSATGRQRVFFPAAEAFYSSRSAKRQQAFSRCEDEEESQEGVGVGGARRLVEESYLTRPSQPRAEAVHLCDAATAASPQQNTA